MTIAKDFPGFDPQTVASQGNAVLGIRDSGKSYTAVGIAERFHDAGIPFVAFDPIGKWRFIRVPGHGAGYPVVVAGGAAGDLPLTVDTAASIVRAAMESGVSLVIDLYDMEVSKADWKRIVADAVRVLLYENGRHGLRHIFIEEAAEFCPQRVGPDQGRVYAEIEKLARMGGNARLGYTLINQRAEEVNKAVLELCDNLFLHRQKGRNSLNALTKWLDVADVRAGKEIVSTLPTLPQGECWAWMAGTDRPVHVKVPPKNSFEPDRRAMRGDVAPEQKKAVDVAQFVSAMRTALAETAKPVEKINTAPTTTMKAALAEEYRRGYGEGYGRGAIDGARSALTFIGDLISAWGIELGSEEALQRLWANETAGEVRSAKREEGEATGSLQIVPEKGVSAALPGEQGSLRGGEKARTGADDHSTAATEGGALHGLRAILSPLRDGFRPSGWHEKGISDRTVGTHNFQLAPDRGRDREVRPSMRKLSPAQNTQTPDRKVAGRTNGSLPAGADGLLAVAVRHWPAKLTWGQVAALAKRKPRGGHFNASRKGLLDAGLVSEVDGAVIPTEEGFTRAGGAPERPADLAQAYRESLPGPADKMFDVLLKRPSISADELGAMLSMQSRGGHWNSGLAMLSRCGLIHKHGDTIVLRKEALRA